MVSADRDLDLHAADWIVRTVIEGVRASAPDAVVGESLADPALAAAADRASVTAVDPAESETVLRAAAAAAAGVVWVTGGTGRGLRSRLGLNAGPASRVPIALVVISDHDVDTAELRVLAGVQVVRAVPPLPTRRSERKLHRLGRSLGSLAAAPQRMDGADAAVRRESAAAAAAHRLRGLLDEGGVEEFQIRGGESMVVEFSDGTRQSRSSPFDSDDELVAACRFLAAYSGGRPPTVRRAGPAPRHPHRHPLAASRRGVRVLAADSGAALQPGRRADLWPSWGCAARKLAAVLVEATAGGVRANVVVAAAMGGGKTTLCQALLAQVPPDERIDTIEDTPELRLREYGIHPNAYERLTRDANKRRGGQALDGRPRARRQAGPNSSKLVVGEVRGEGTMALLDAMSSGLDGCLVTLHSPSRRGRA